MPPSARPCCSLAEVSTVKHQTSDWLSCMSIERQTSQCRCMSCDLPALPLRSTYWAPLLYTIKSLPSLNLYGTHVLSAVLQYFVSFSVNQSVYFSVHTFLVRIVIVDTSLDALMHFAYVMSGSSPWDNTKSMAPEIKHIF